MSNAPLIEFRGVTKICGITQDGNEIRANDQLSFSVHEGRIHAIIGENGAGKSTAMKILFGLDRPTEGRIFFRGKPVVFSSPKDAKALGFGMIHQHFQLASALPALDHVALEEGGAWWTSFFRKVDRAAWETKLHALSEKFQMPVPWNENIRELPVGVQQRIEILKLLAFDAKILILDEPTAVLTPHEIVQFLERLKSLRAAGKTILLITHKLKEVLAVADDVSVLRGGKLVSSGPLANETEASLASKMVGSDFKPRELKRTPSTSEVLLTVKNLSGKKDQREVLSEIQFSLHKGEILGIAGVEGNGQSDLIRALIVPRESKCEWTGEIEFAGKNLLRLSNPEIRGLGIGLVPEDRLHQAVVPALPAEENYQLGRSDLTRGLWVQTKKRDAELRQSIDEYHIRPQNPKITFGNFSGGNQQKLVLARELGARPRMLVVAQPTRGVDIGAIEMIHDTLIQSRNRSMGVLLISSELEELLRLSDRLLVFSKGKIAAELTRDQFDLGHLGRLMGGGGK